MERLLDKQSSPEAESMDKSADKIQQYSTFSDSSQSLINDRTKVPSTSDDSSDPDDLAHVALSEHLSSLSIGEAVNDRFFGKSRYV